MGRVTYKVRHQTTVGKSSSGESEVGLAIGPEVSLVKSCGVDVIIVASVQERVPKDEESSMLFRHNIEFNFSKAIYGNEVEEEEEDQKQLN